MSRGEKTIFANPDRLYREPIDPGYGWKLDGPAQLPREMLYYRPSGSDNWLKTPVTFAGTHILRKQLWAQIKGEAMSDESGDRRDRARIFAASDVWIRVYFGVVQKNIFKAVDWTKLLKEVVRLTGTRGEDAILDFFESEGKKKYGSNIPSFREVSVRLHYSDRYLDHANPDDAQAFLQKNAYDIITMEREAAKELGLDGEKEVVGSKRKRLDKTLRNRLGRIKGKCDSSGLLTAVNLEALAQLVESLDYFYIPTALRNRERLKPLGARLFDYYHVAGPRLHDGAVPSVPVIWSDTLRTSLMFISGEHDSTKAPMPGMVIAQDLLAVLNGADPLDERYSRAVYVALGFVEFYRSWLVYTRSRDREIKRRKRQPNIEFTEAVERRAESEKYGNRRISPASTSDDDF